MDRGEASTIRNYIVCTVHLIFLVLLNLLIKSGRSCERKLECLMASIRYGLSYMLN